ncbi:MAG: HAD-IA family hydrolase [Chloroflexota bacterium]
MERISVDTILFDMDGTLIDESRSYREAIRMTAEYLLRSAVTRGEVEAIKRIPGLNNDWDAAWALVAGRQGNHALPDAADRSSQTYRRLRDIFQTYYLGDTVWSSLSGRDALFPWSEPLIALETPLIDPETLTWLLDFQIGIVTSRPRAEACMAMKQHGLEGNFNVSNLVALEDAPFEKPHPVGLQSLARMLHSQSAAYVGDSVNDALAAFAAEMEFIHVGNSPFERVDVESRVRFRVRSVNQISGICVREMTACR